MLHSHGQQRPFLPAQQLLLSFPTPLFPILVAFSELEEVTKMGSVVLQRLLCQKGRYLN